MFNSQAQTEKLFETYIKLPQPVKATGVLLFNLFQHIVIRISALPGKLILFVTNQCNASCGHCRYQRFLNNGEELPLSAIEKIFVSLGRNLSGIALTGGEPFLRKDLDQVCAYLYNINRIKTVDIFTNGIIPEDIRLISRNIILKVPIFLRIWVSLDGQKDTHDKIRGVPDAFENALKTIVYLKQLKTEFRNIQVSVVTTISTVNFAEVEQVVCFVKKLEINHVLHFIRNSPFDIYNLNPQYAFENLEARSKEFQLPELNLLAELNTRINKLLKTDVNPSLFSRLESIRRKYTLQIMKDNRRLFPCVANRIEPVIYSNGDVALCAYSKPVGNLSAFNYDFYSFWKSKNVAEMQSRLNNCVCTEPCHLLSSMRYDLKTLLKCVEN